MIAPTAAATVEEAAGRRSSRSGGSRVRGGAVSSASGRARGPAEVLDHAGEGAVGGLSTDGRVGVVEPVGSERTAPTFSASRSTASLASW